MATLQSPGIGSGLDVNGLVSQLVAAERTPAAARLTREKTAIGTEISALGQLKGALAAFNSVLTPLKTVNAFAARSATSADEEVFTATATTAAATSKYDITVTALAKAHQIASTTFPGGSGSVIGPGTLTISMGSSSFDVVIDPDKTRLSEIRDAINTATGNVGIRAAIVTATDGAHLVLSSEKTGAANAIKVTTGATDGLQRLIYDPPTTATNYTQVVAAQDASITIAGFAKTSASNVITDAIDEVTITLKKEDPGNPVALNIAANTDATKSSVQNFVSQYNTLIRTLTDLGKYDAATGNSGPMIGDALLRAVTTEVRRGLGDAVPGVTGTVTALSQIGITTAKDGTLTLNDSKLSAALSSNFDSVSQLFASTKGVAARLSTAITARLDTKGEIASRNVSLDKRTKSVTQREQTLNVRIAKLEALYRSQFGALDTALARMQSTSQYLSQQLANLPKIE